MKITNNTLINKWTVTTVFVFFLIEILFLYVIFADYHLFIIYLNDEMTNDKKCINTWALIYLFGGSDKWL